MQYSRAAKRHFLCPKGVHKKPSVPVPECSALPWVLDKLAPVERFAMAEIAENADMLEVDGEMWLLAPITSQRTLEALAAFGAEGEDRENDLEDEVEVDIARFQFCNLNLGLAQDEDMEEDDPGGTYGEL